MWVYLSARTHVYIKRFGIYKMSVRTDSVLIGIEGHYY